MNRLLGHGAASNYPRPGRAFEYGCTEQKTSENGCDMRLFARGPGGKSGSGLPVELHRQEAAGVSCSTGCLPYQSRFMLGHCFGVYPTPGGSALFCFGYAALRVTVSIFDGPSVNAVLGTWESRPTR